MEDEVPAPKVGPEEQEAWAVCRVPRADVFYLRYTLEAYEGLCLPTTLPGQGGIVRLLTTEALRAQLEEVLAALAGEVDLEVLEWGSGDETSPYD